MGELNYFTLYYSVIVTQIMAKYFLSSLFLPLAMLEDGFTELLFLYHPNMNVSTAEC